MRSLSLLASLALACLCWPALAQSSWPEKVVRIVVPYPPGGSVDSSARLVSQVMQPALGQPVIVENRAGAAGAVGSASVAKADPDGYTLVWGTVSSHAINMSLYADLDYDAVADFAPVTLLMEQPLMLVVPVSSDITSLSGFVDALRGGASLNIGSPGIGTTGHLTAEFIKKELGVDITHVGYSGSSPMLTDLAGGHIDAGIDNIPSALALVNGGKLRALAVTRAARSPLAPDVPTLSEALPGLSVVAWQGLFAPAGVPEPVLDRLNAEIVKALHDPQVVARLTETGNTLVGNSRAEFTDFVAAENLRWAEIVKASGAKVE
jgi:tripartite-type tricarboxylate transporter receptor subunit TctC